MDRQTKHNAPLTIVKGGGGGWGGGGGGGGGVEGGVEVGVGGAKKSEVASIENMLIHLHHFCNKLFHHDFQIWTSPFGISGVFYNTVDKSAEQTLYYRYSFK